MTRGELLMRALPHAARLTDSEARATLIAKLTNYAEASLRGFVEIAERTDREWGRMWMSPTERDADEKAEAAELAAEAQDRINQLLLLKN